MVYLLTTIWVSRSKLPVQILMRNPTDPINSIMLLADQACKQAPVNSELIKSEEPPTPSRV